MKIAAVGCCTIPQSLHYKALFKICIFCWHIEQGNLSTVLCFGTGVCRGLTGCNWYFDILTGTRPALYQRIWYHHLLTEFSHAF